MRLRASAARPARPFGESLLELTFQTLGRDVMCCLNLGWEFDPDPCRLEGDDLHVVGHVLPVGVVIALAFFKRIFSRSLPMNQAHSLIMLRLRNLLRAMPCSGWQDDDVARRSSEQRPLRDGTRGALEPAVFREPRRDGRFDHAIAECAAAYADLSERDHRALVQSIADGKIAAVEEV